MLDEISNEVQSTFTLCKKNLNINIIDFRSLLHPFSILKILNFWNSYTRVQLMKLRKKILNVKLEDLENHQ